MRSSTRVIEYLTVYYSKYLTVCMVESGGIINYH